MNITQVKTDHTHLSENPAHYSAFRGEQLLVSGPLLELLRGLKEQHIEQTGEVLIFDDQTGRQVDYDLRGSLTEVLERYAPAAPTRGRPKLGVLSREVSLLPRHWEWLDAQGNASATLRRLIDDERRRWPDQERRAQAQAAADRFMGSVAGNFSGYQEATRALYAGDQTRFNDLIKDWPHDIRQHTLKLAQGAFTIV